MNKQEVLKRIETQKETIIELTGWAVYVYIVELIKSLDEPQKVVVPQFVADWYEENKDDFEFNVWDWIAFRDEPEKLKNKEFNYWINDCEGNPIQTLVNMHQFGYEKEPKYIVKLKSVVCNSKVLKHNINEDTWYMSNKTNYTDLKSYNTKKELEDAGFGEVFNSPLFEVEEVE